MHSTRTPRRPPGTGRVPGYGGDRTRTPRRPRPGGLPSRVAPSPARARPPCGARGDAGCPNLLQRPGSSRSDERETLIFRASARRRSRRGGPLQQIRTRTRPGPPQEPHAHHPAPAHPRHHDDPALRAAVPGEKGFNMKVIQRMVLKTRSTRVAATCSDESSSSGRLLRDVWMRLPGAMRRIVERWGAGPAVMTHSSLLRVCWRVLGAAGSAGPVVGGGPGGAGGGSGAFVPAPP